MADEDPIESKTPVDPLTRARCYRPSKPLLDFVRRVAEYSDYTHDDVDEGKILHELQREAARLLAAHETPQPPSNLQVSAYTAAEWMSVGLIDRLVPLADYERVRIELAAEREHTSKYVAQFDNERLRAALQEIASADPSPTQLEKWCNWVHCKARDALAGVPDETSGWRPIETAPKGGRWVLLAWPAVTDVPFVGYRQEGVWRAATNGDHWVDMQGPTHWMPLPAMPSKKANGEPT